MTNKKNITTQLLAFLAMACLGLAPAAASASEVTGTLSADGTVIINSTSSDDDLTGNVVDDEDDDTLTGNVVDDSDGTLTGTVSGGTSGGGGSSGGGGGGGGDGDGDVLGAQTTNLPFIPSTGAPIVAQSQVTPGLPNTGELPYSTDTSAWIVMIGSALAVFGTTFGLTRFLLKGNGA